MLTFKTLDKPETQTISGIDIPKRGCLTVAEELAIRNLGATINKQVEGMTQAQADLELKQQVVSILIRSRLDPNWDIEQTKAPKWVVAVNGETQTIEPDMVLLDGLYEFFMGEQRRWVSLEELIQPSETKGKKK